MAQGFDNPNPISDGALYFIRDSAGYRQLFQVATCDPQDSGSITGDKGSAGVLGSHRTASDFPITLTTKVARAVPDEVDWYGLKDDDEYFTFEVQYIGNDRHVYDRCRVASVNQTAGEDGTVTRNVAMHAERRRIITP